MPIRGWTRASCPPPASRCWRISWTWSGAASLIARESYGPPPEQAARARDGRARARAWRDARPHDRNRRLDLRRTQPKDDRQREPGIDARAEPAYGFCCALRVGRQQRAAAARWPRQLRTHDHPARRRSLRDRPVEAPAE